MVGLIMGTGCGSGVVINKQLVEGLHGIGGEWGHNLMCGESTPCYCGKGGCVETVIAGPSLERWFRERTGNALRLPEIVRLSNEGNPDALATLDRLSEKFAEAIAVLINIIDPHAIVIGGGVGNIDILYAGNPRAHRQVRLQQRRPHAPSSGPLSVTAPASSAPPCSSPDPALRRRLPVAEKRVSRTREAKTAATGSCDSRGPATFSTPIFSRITKLRSSSAASNAVKTSALNRSSGFRISAQNSAVFKVPPRSFAEREKTTVASLSCTFWRVRARYPRPGTSLRL